MGSMCGNASDAAEAPAKKAPVAATKQELTKFLEMLEAFVRTKMVVSETNK